MLISIQTAHFCPFITIHPPSFSMFYVLIDSIRCFNHHRVEQAQQKTSGFKYAYITHYTQSANT